MYRKKLKTVKVYFCKSKLISTVFEVLDVCLQIENYFKDFTDTLLLYRKWRT